MCGPSSYVDYSDSATDDFKKTFSKIHLRYRRWCLVTAYSIKIGFLLTGGLEIAMKVLEALNKERHSSFSTTILVILSTATACSAVASLIKKNHQKEVDELLGYTQYFLTKPKDINYDQVQPLSEFTVDRHITIESLKFRYH